ncbi:MAG: hypothetical protein JST93_30400 [Acidobacteria bacterium]|nr:hypothetical protein [Acidobacteriota bacterium]
MRIGLAAILAVPFLMQGALKLKPLTAEELRLLNATGTPKVAGVHRPLPSDAIKKGKWKKGASGQPVWSLEIESPGAKSLRVEFASFQAGDGKARVCEDDGKHCYGPYTAQTLMENGSFWSDVVEGDRIVIEFTAAKKTDVPPFRLARISHMK